jgi:hypothetical protein
MLHLAERSEAGTLTPEEQAEFYGYLHIGNLPSGHAIHGPACALHTIRPKQLGSHRRAEGAT